MPIRLTAASLLLAIVVSTMSAAETPPRPPSLLALGDSYTIGQGLPAEARWPAQLAAALRATHHPLEASIIATTGWTTDEMLAGIAARAPKGPFDLVTLQIGVNDQFRGGTIETYDQRFAVALATAITLAGERPSRVIVVSIPDWGVTPFAKGRDAHAIASAIDGFNAVAKRCAESAGAAWIDVTPISRRASTDPSLLASDGLHPSAAMYASWVELLLPAATRALDSEPASTSETTAAAAAP